MSTTPVNIIPPTSPNLSAHLTERGRKYVVINEQAYKMTFKSAEKVVAVSDGAYNAMVAKVQKAFTDMPNVTKTSFSGKSIKAIHIKFPKQTTGSDTAPAKVSYTDTKGVKHDLTIPAKSQAVYKKIMETLGSVLKPDSPLSQQIRELGAFAPAGDAIKKLKRSDLLDDEVMDEYARHVLQDPTKGRHVSTTPRTPDAIDKGDIFMEVNKSDHAAFLADKTPGKSFTLFVHFPGHYGAIVAKDDQLFSYDPKGTQIDERIDLAKLYQTIYGRAAKKGEIHDFGKANKKGVHQTASDGVNCGAYSLEFAKQMLKADAGKASTSFYSYCKMKLTDPVRIRKNLASELHL